MTKPYRSKTLAAAHEIAVGLREAGIMDSGAMKTFDAMRLTPAKPLSVRKVKWIRLRKKAS